ncbi:MAG: hypothetical protein K2L84_00230 [Muribaculaceae bacterium]|nr:hypothetical protein [Muribaculaceae bacterium]
MKKFATLLFLIIAPIIWVYAEDYNDEDEIIYDYENFGPSPGTESNPLLNVDFYITGVSAFYFYSPVFGNPPSFRHFLGYTAEYADGTVETDSIRLDNTLTTMAHSLTYLPPRYFTYEPEKFVGGGEDFYIDEENKTIVLNQYGNENSYYISSWVDNEETIQRLMAGIRGGEKRTGIVSTTGYPDINDFNVDENWLNDFTPFTSAMGSTGYMSMMKVYDENGQEVMRIFQDYICFIFNAYLKKFNTLTEPDTLRLIDQSLDYTTLGNAYGADETIRTEGYMTLKYHDYTMKYSFWHLNHIYLSKKTD